MSELAEPSDQTGANAGEWLQSARERASLSVEQVAKDLNLDVRKVQAMEAGRYAELGAPVFAKGYLRQYARLVQIPEEALLSRYEGSGKALVQADPVPATLGLIPQANPRLPRWALRVVGALLLVAVGVVLWNLRDSSTTAVQPVSAPAQLVSPLQALSQRETQAVAGVTEAPPATVGAGQLQLEFVFSADSWVEVYDANNQQVLYDMGRAGDQRTVNALAPVRVMLGSAAAVTMRVNAQPVVVPDTHVEANVARFVVNAAGGIEP